MSNRIGDCTISIFLLLKRVSRIRVKKSRLIRMSCSSISSFENCIILIRRFRRKNM